MKYAKRRTKQNKISKFKKKNLVWIYLAIFISIQVYSTIQTATTGARLADLEMQAKELSEEKRVLEDRLVSKSSLKALEEKAEGLGFSRHENIVYIKPGEPFAKAN